MTDPVVVVDPGNYTPFYDINLCDALASLGWDVELMTAPHLFEVIQPPATVRVTKIFRTFLRLRRRRTLRRTMKALSYPADLIRLDRALADRAPGVLHVQWALLPWVDAWFWRRWRARGWTIVYTAHDVGGLAGTTPRPLRLANRRLFRLAGGVVAHSSLDRDRVVAAGVTPGRVHLMAQGSPGLFQAPPIDRCDARQTLGIDPGRPTILLFGFLKAYKGLGLLLTSLERVRERVPNVLLLIAGEPMMGTRAWTRVIRDRGLERHIVWHRTYVPTDRVSTYFSAADVVALPYTAASASAVLVNAFAHARPVVATDVGATSEMLIDGETGLLAPANDSVRFAAALEALLVDRVRAAAMGKAAHARAQRHHSWTLIAQETSALYRAVVPAARTAR